MYLRSSPKYSTSWAITHSDVGQVMTEGWSVEIKLQGRTLGLRLENLKFAASSTEQGPCILLQELESEFPLELQLPPDPRTQMQWALLLVMGGATFRPFSYFYRNIKKIGSGSFAQVYSGISTVSNEEVVVKSIEKRRLQKANALTEVGVLRKIKHPYIVDMYCSFENGESDSIDET